MFYWKIDNFGCIMIEKIPKTWKILKIIAKIKNSKSGGLIIELEKNGFQILVWHENLHKIGHVNANYGKNGTTCPPSNHTKVKIMGFWWYKSENYGVLGRPGTCFILFHSHTLFYGEFHAEQESEVRFSLSQILSLQFFD